MLDALVKLRVGEKAPIWGGAVAGIDPATGLQGTLTISAGATCGLYTATGAAYFYADPDDDNAQILAGGGVTGYDTGALAAPRVWYELDTAAIALPAGFYTLVFTFTATGSDGLVRVDEPAVGVLVEAVA